MRRYGNLCANNVGMSNLAPTFNTLSTGYLSYQLYMCTMAVLPGANFVHGQVTMSCSTGFTGPWSVRMQFPTNLSGPVSGQFVVGE